MRKPKSKEILDEVAAIWDAQKRSLGKDRRDRFAMAALVGLQFHRDGSLFTTDGVVRQAVTLADALIAELDKEK